MPISTRNSSDLVDSTRSLSEPRSASLAEVEHQAHVDQPHEEAAGANGRGQAEFLRGYKSDSEFLGHSAAKGESTSAGAKGEGISSEDRQRAEAQLTPHLEQRVKDQAALSKWNVNGEGRNQGVVHLLDYANARPSNLSLSKESDVKKQTGLSDEQYAALSKADRSGHRSYTRNQLTDQGKDYKLTHDQVNKLVSKGYLEPLSTPELDKANSAVKKAQGELDGLVKNKTDELTKQGVTGKQFGQQLKQFKSSDSSYAAKSEQLSKAKAQAEAVTRYTTQTDQSKKGRLERIANADGKDSLPRGKEIEEGTRIVSGLMNNKENLTATSKKAPSESMTQWRPTGESSQDPNANPATKWKQTVVPPSELKTTATADFKGNGLAVKTWGTLDDPNADVSEQAKKLGISTVMGNS
jgi:hypothetical protein